LWKFLSHPDGCEAVRARGLLACEPRPRSNPELRQRPQVFVVKEAEQYGGTVLLRQLAYCFVEQRGEIGPIRIRRIGRELNICIHGVRGVFAD